MPKLPTTQLQPKSSESIRQRRVSEVQVLLRGGEGARALPIIGDRWVVLILRDAFLGARRFDDFRRLTGAARSTLTTRLTALVRQGVLCRRLYCRSPKRYEYRLTDKGMDFYPVALALWNWESRWAGEFGLPPQLLHKTCGKVMRPQLACAHCKQPIDPHDVSYKIGPGAASYAKQRSAGRRRRQAPATHAAGVDTTMFHSVDTLGDRWTVLLLACLFFRLHRYDDIFTAIGIATNILADRLRRLLSAGIVEQHLYQQSPPRYEYRLTEKGLGLYPSTLAIQEWGMAWLPSPFGPALKLKHMPCRHQLRSIMQCDCCHAQIDPHEVGVKSSAKWQKRRRAV